MLFIDLFCGAGGFSYGLEQAGHKCVLGVDHDKDAIETFKLNHEADTYCGDIRNLKDVPKVDMVVGGPPCQGFSTVGKGDPNDPRNFLFKEFIRIVKLADPKVVMLENVKGILSKKNEKVLKSIYREFEKLGFTMQAKLYEAERYGVPQIRRRVIIVGTKQGVSFEPPEGNIDVSCPYSDKATVETAFATIYPKEDAPESDKEILQYIIEGGGIRYEEDEELYSLPSHLRYKEWDKLPEGRFRQTKFKRLHRDEFSPTILTSASYYHPTLNRLITPREAAAIQTFPNSFKFFGSKTSQYRQIGNAVPVELARRIGECVKTKENK